MGDRQDCTATNRSRTQWCELPKAFVFLRSSMDSLYFNTIAKFVWFLQARAAQPSEQSRREWCTEVVVRYAQWVEGGKGRLLKPLLSQIGRLRPRTDR